MKRQSFLVAPAYTRLGIKSGKKAARAISSSTLLQLHPTKTETKFIELGVSLCVLIRRTGSCLTHRSSREWLLARVKAMNLQENRSLLAL